MTDIPTRPLNDGTTIPAMGFGSPDTDPASAEQLFCDALSAGYRLIDTAQAYGNEDVVGRALQRTEVPREEILVATKVPGKDHGYEETLASFERSRAALDLERVDLYLIHWPNPGWDKYVDTWRAMIHLREQGAVRSIGVCNFTPAFLDRLLAETGVMPAVNQVERHPRFPNAAQLAADAARGVVTMAWSPLGRGDEFIREPVLAEIARAHDVTPAQVVVRWHVQAGAVPIPYSRRVERIASNKEVFDFELTEAEMAAVDGLERGRLWGQDPAECNYL